MKAWYFFLLLALAAAVLLLRRVRKGRKHVFLRAKSQNRQVLRVVAEINAQQLANLQRRSGKQTGAAVPSPPLISRSDFRLCEDKDHNFSYFLRKTDSTAPPLLVLPPAFSTLPECVLRLADAVQRDIYILIQHGLAESLTRPLRNEYLASDDIDALIETIDTPLYLLGYAAGAVRCCNYVCGARNARILRVFALFTLFDPLQPLFLSHKAQRDIGAQAAQFLHKNARQLLDQRFLAAHELARILADPTGVQFDELWARRLGLDLEAYYQEIQPRFWLASAQSEIIFFSCKTDDIAGRLVPSTDELGSCHLVCANVGQHLACLTSAGDVASLFVSRMVEEM